MTDVLAGCAASWMPAADRIASAGDPGRRSNVYGLSHAGGLLIAGVFHLALSESGQVAVDEHMVGIDDVQSAGAAPEEVRTPDERPPRGLGIVEADDQGDRQGGLGGAGIGGTGDESVVRQRGPGTGRDNWRHDALGQGRSGAPKCRDPDQAGDARQRPGGQDPQVHGGGMPAEVDDVADDAGRIP
jgi:hypothetical protein